MRTLFRFERRRVYSSRTSCSRGLQAAGWFEGGSISAIAVSERRLKLMDEGEQKVCSFNEDVV